MPPSAATAPMTSGRLSRWATRTDRPAERQTSIGNERRKGVFMRAAVWHGRNDMRVDQVPDPKILNQRDAIVRISSTAICGSDLHLFDGFVPTMMKGDIMGHEFMGEVMEVGREVKN